MNGFFHTLSVDCYQSATLKFMYCPISVKSSRLRVIKFSALKLVS